MRGRIGAMMRTSGMRRNENSRSRGHRDGHGTLRRRVTLAVLLVVGGVAAASAQEPPARDGATMEKKVSGGWVVAPDFKFTRIDEGDAALVGAYGGKFIDRGFLVGGGAYVLRGAHDVGMAYGGGLVEWFGNPDRLVDFSVRGFIGLGTATLTDRFAFSEGCGGDFSIFNDDMFGSAKGSPPTVSGGPCWFGAETFAADGSVVDSPVHTAGDWDIGWPSDPFGSFGHRQNFFLAEPQASIHLNVTPWLRIGGGAGYRLIGRGGDFTERLRGLTANIGVQIGPR